MKTNTINFKTYLPDIIHDKGHQSLNENLQIVSDYWSKNNCISTTTIIIIAMF